MGGDFRNGCEPGEEIVGGFTITAHVGVIYIGQEPKSALLLEDDGAVKLEFKILGVGAAEVSIEVDAVGNLGHEPLGKTGGPMTVVIFEHGRVREAARIGSVVVGSVVVDRPVQELEVAIGAVGIEIEKLRQTELPKPHFQAAFRKLAEQRK